MGRAEENASVVFALGMAYRSPDENGTGADTGGRADENVSVSFTPGMVSKLNIPTLFASSLMGLSDNKYVILLLINLMLLVLGCIMDMAPLILICSPILLPVCLSIGMNSIQFGIMLIFNLAIGLCTPPVGNALFIGCAVGKRRLEDVVKQMLPLYGVMLVGLMLVTYVPFITSWLPTLLGYLN